jgi:Fibrinogen beta and gamma chains, C-terminal globular domain
MDGIKNGTETDVDCGGSCATKCEPNKGCAGPIDCSGDLNCSGTPKTCSGHFESCKELKAQHDTLPSGVYTLTTAAKADYKAYCDMTLEGGGWSLAVKGDGSNSKFYYDNKMWTDTTTFGTPDATKADAKLQVFNEMPFTDVLVCLKTLDAAGCRKLTGFTSLGTPTLTGPGYSSLYAVFLAGQSVNAATPVRDAQLDSWVAGAKLQANCNRVGLRRGGGGVALLRFGIVMDDQMDCGEPDSWVGFGGTPVTKMGTCLMGITLPSIGAAHGCSGAGPDTDPAGVVSTFGWVFVK